MTATTIFTIPAGETFQSFAQLNNILIVITDLNRYFLLYDVDTGTYSELEEIPMPLMDFQENILYTGLIAESGSAGNYLDAGYYDIIDAHTTARNYFNTLVNSYLSKGIFRGMVLLRFAYKLFDGSYIKHSNIYYLKVGYDVELDDYHDDANYYFAYENISLGNIKYSYKFSQEDINILVKYSNVIQSLDIFMTNITPDTDQNTYVVKLVGEDGYAINEEDGWISTGVGYVIVPENSVGKKKMINEINYYKIHSIELSSILEDNYLETLEELDLSDLQNILTFETLPVDNFTHHKVWGSKNYNYNSRLHFGDVTTKFFKGFYPFCWGYDYSTASTNNYLTKIYIRTDQGEKIVYRKFDTPLYSYLLYTSHVISYPDSRAYKIEFLREDPNSPGDYYGRTIPVAFDLKPHLFLNLSYYINPDGIDTKTPIAITLDVLHDGIDNDLLNDPNRVQVSRLDNALVYEATNSYQVGNDDETIIGFGSVVEPLSDGQFGQFPLYIFTTVGNFVLSQGSGAILYSNILPLNKDVCNNPLSITDIGGGVVYSTEKGLMILSGRQITEISQFLKGDPREYLINDTTYQDYLNDQNFVQLLSDLSTVNFLTYLSGAIIGFDYVNKEIIVSNDTYTFSYVYNLESKSWHKITEVYSEFVKVIPKTYGYSSGILYDLTDEDYDYIETLIQTRPIKLDTLNHKSIERLVLRGYYDVKDLTYSALLIYGSVDGKSYKFLTGRSRQDDSTFQDLLVKNTHSSFKYFILVFVGQLKDSSINFIEVSYSERFGNKLR